MTKTKAKRATAKKKVAKKTKSAAHRTGKTHAIVKQKCAHPTTLFEVEFPTTVLFWAGVALFFFIVLLIAQSLT
jgi:hypothetical protein